jgi:hypothetical protein
MISEHARLEALLRDLGKSEPAADELFNQILERMAQQRPFEHYQPQPDTAERIRLQIQTIPFALPEVAVKEGRVHVTHTLPKDDCQTVTFAPPEKQDD